MAAAAPYVELHAHSAFSFLDGASTPAELASAAAQLGYPAFALTDHDGVWGSMEFVQACKEIELRRRDQADHRRRGDGREDAHLTLLVEDASGYRNLCRLLTAAHSHTRDSKARTAGQPWVSLEQVEEHAAGLVCLSGCAGRDARCRLGEGGRGRRGRNGAAVARHLRAGPLPGRAAATLLAAGPQPQPLARRACRAAGGAHRRHRQRPLSRQAPRPPAGRVRRDADGDDAGGVRALRRGN